MLGLIRKQREQQQQSVLASTLRDVKVKTDVYTELVGIKLLSKLKCVTAC